jgi:hypothetical protein
MIHPAAASIVDLPIALSPPRKGYGSSHQYQP